MLTSQKIILCVGGLGGAADWGAIRPAPASVIQREGPSVLTPFTCNMECCYRRRMLNCHVQKSESFAGLLRHRSYVLGGYSEGRSPPGLIVKPQFLYYSYMYCVCWRLKCFQFSFQSSAWPRYMSIQRSQGN